MIRYRYCKYAVIVGVAKGNIKKQNECPYLVQINEIDNIRFNWVPKCPSDCLKNEAGHNSCYIIEEGLYE